jgi:hypothetical protein
VSEEHGEGEADSGIDDHEICILHRIGMDEVTHGVDDGAHARPGEEYALHRGHQRLVLRVAELVALVGGLVELAGHEDGEQGHHDVDAGGDRLEGHGLGSEKSATTTAPQAKRTVRVSEKWRARIS